MRRLCRLLYLDWYIVYWYGVEDMAGLAEVSWMFFFGESFVFFGYLVFCSGSGVGILFL